MSPEARHRLIARGFKALASIRADRWLAPLARGRGVILTFHHVRPPRPDPFQPNRLLEITPDFLARVLTLLQGLGYDLVPLSDVPRRLADRGGAPFAALTFDDGYRDNLEYAAPILEQHRAPWTAFVAPDFAAGQGQLWWLELEEVVRRQSRMRFELDGDAYDLPAETPGEKGAAFARIYGLLRAGSEQRLRDVVGGWYRELGFHSDALVSELCLDWNGIKALAARPGVTIGAHTMSHPMLAKHDAGTARREIVESRDVLETRLGRRVTQLAYPVGDPSSAGRREFNLAREARLMVAVTTRPGHLFEAHLQHLTALPRISVNGLFQTEAAFRSLVSGVPFLLWNRGRRVNVS